MIRSIGIAGQRHRGAVADGELNAANRLPVWSNQTLGNARVECCSHIELQVRRAALDQSIDIEIQRRDGDVSPGENRRGWRVDGRRHLSLSQSYGIVGTVLCHAVVLPDKILVLGWILAGREPRITAEGETTGRADIDWIACDFACNDHAIGCICDIHSTFCIDNATIHIKIRRYGRGLTFIGDRRVGILKNTDHTGGSRTCFRRECAFVVDVDTAGIKDRIFAIDCFGDSAVVNQHV